MQPRPALKCVEGHLEGLNITMVQVVPGPATDYYCVEGELRSDALNIPYVPTPEPGFVFGIIVTTLLLGALYERAWPGPATRNLSRVRVPRQRRRLRDRIREVFRTRV